MDTADYTPRDRARHHSLGVRAITGYRTTRIHPDQARSAFHIADTA